MVQYKKKRNFFVTFGGGGNKSDKISIFKASLNHPIKRTLKLACKNIAKIYLTEKKVVCYNVMKDETHGCSPVCLGNDINMDKRKTLIYSSFFISSGSQ